MPLIDVKGDSILRSSLVPLAFVLEAFIPRLFSFLSLYAAKSLEINPVEFNSSSFSCFYRTYYTILSKGSISLSISSERLQNSL